MYKVYIRIQILEFSPYHLIENHQTIFELQIILTLYNWRIEQRNQQSTDSEFETINGGLMAFALIRILRKHFGCT